MHRLIGLVVCTVFLCLRVALAQDQKKVDSLHRILEHRVGFCEQFETLYELCFEYIQKDNVKALAFIEQAEVAALASGDSLWIVKSMRVKAVVLYYLERNAEALHTLQEVLPLAERNEFKTEAAYILQFLGRVNLYEGQYDKALWFLLERLRLAKDLGDTELLADAWHDVAICYYKLSDYSQALAYYFRALEGYESLSMRSGTILTNIALCYANLNDFENARFFSQQVTEMNEYECSIGCRMNLKYTLGLISTLEKDDRSAEVYFLESYAIAKAEDNTRFQLDNIYLLTELFLKQGKYQRARQYLTIAENLMKENTSFNLEMIKIYSRLSDLHIKLQNYKTASLYQAKYIALRDSIHGEALTKSLMKVQAEYLHRESQAKILTQAEIISLTREVVEGQRKLTLTTGAVAGLVGVILIFVFREYQRKMKLNLLLDKKVRERTHELESTRQELIQYIREKEALFRRSWSGMHEDVMTLKGLCQTACSEVSDPVARMYLERIDNISKELVTNSRLLPGDRIARTL